MQARDGKAGIGMVGIYEVECVFDDGYSELRKVCVDGKTERTRLGHIQEMIKAWWPITAPCEVNIKLIRTIECE